MDIKIDDLSKSYGAQKAVDHISFEVKTGEILGFLGPNGAGKTTTMKMITNYLEPDSGQITLGGESVTTGKHRKNIGYLPEHNPLYEDMPLMDYLGFCAEIQGTASSDILDRIHQMIKLCGLNLEKHKKINELSKGYRQRVGLAQSMIHDPAVLILDEPTTGLDPNQIVEIRDLIRRLGREKTVILSTHILPEVEATCDRILIINRGQIVADGTAESLRKQSQGQQILRLKIENHESRIIDSILNLPSVASVDIQGDYLEVQSQDELKSNKAIFELCSRHQWPILEMTPMETKLEDIFRDLTLN